jgi:hypothetical protein
LELDLERQGINCHGILQELVSHYISCICYLPNMPFALLLQMSQCPASKM